MTTIAYIANQFPSPLEPYVIDEVVELRRRGVKVICCSGKHVSEQGLSLAERDFWRETIFFQPLSDTQILRAVKHLAFDLQAFGQLLRTLLGEPGTSARRLRGFGHMVMGSALAEQLAPLKVDHIHAHHGYFACWMALVAARLLGIGFSFTLHGSDLLLRGDLLAAKLRACQFCMTVSEFNRQYILQHYPSTSSRKIVLRRLGVDSVPSPMPTSLESAPRQRRFCLLSVGRLHPVKDHDFLIQGCAALRDQGLDFICWILGEGRERRALEEQIVRLGLCGRIYLIGHVAHNDLPRYYGYADLVVMTSRSEGIPVVLMEAMAHEKIVLAPAITGIAELIDHRRTGFLYQPGSLPDFISAVSWIHGHQSSLSGLQHAAAASIAANYNRRRNLRVLPSNFWPAYLNRTATMRILYCNKYDYPFSGTEAYLFDLIHRVEERGHETALFSMDHSIGQGRSPSFAGRTYRLPHLDFKDPQAGLPKKIRMAAHALYSPSARRAMRHCIADFSPQLAHVRSIYHHLSPSILWELKRRGVPVLYHLNDFKILCPTYNLVAEGRPCELCSHGAFHHVATHGCYSGRRSSAVVLAAEAYLHKWLRTYERCVDLFLAPSEFVRRKLIASGFPASRIEVLAHFQPLPGDEDHRSDEGYVLYFGRLSPEKGVYELLRTMVQLPHVPLVIAGDGPDRPRLEALAKELNLRQVLFTGTLHGEKLRKLIAGCSFSVFPSHAYETFGKSILESYAWGKPVIASDLGSRRELVQHGVTGLLYSDGDREQLGHSIGFLFDRPDLVAAMAAGARSRVKEKHHPEEHLDKMVDLYHRMTSARNSLSMPQARRREPARRGVRVAFIGGRGLCNQYSGIESYYEHAGRELARLGHEVTVYCRSYFTPALEKHNGMWLRRLPTIRSKHLETLVHTALSTAQAMLSDCDIVHYHGLGPALFALLPRLAGKKTVVTVQGLDWQRGKWGTLASRVLRWGEAAAIRLPHATMVVSRTLEEHFRRRYQRETIFVPNGATVSPKRPPRRLREWNLTPENYVLFLGRFSPEKNCHLLIDAFKNLDTGMKLVLAGGSSYSDSYAQSLRREQSHQIRFFPWLSGSDLEELLSHAALFVLPSEIEGLSLALLDAMAAGVCVLTSDIAENKELVDGVGFTHRRGDVADLQRMLDLLIRDPELRRQSAVRGRERIQEQYRWPAVARSIEKTYHRVLGWSSNRGDVPDPEALNISTLAGTIPRYGELPHA